MNNTTYNLIKEDDLDVLLKIGFDKVNTLRDLLDNLDIVEEFIDVDYYINNDRDCSYLQKFVAWTDNYVIITINDDLYQTALIKVNRHPKYS